MKLHNALCLGIFFISMPLALAANNDDAQAVPARAFEQLLSFEGDWLDVDGSLGMKDEVAVTYRVSANRTTVIESIFVGKPYEMVTVFYRDQNHIALTHYCSLGNQPRMQSVALEPDQLEFSLSGGSGFDPAQDRHMHSRIMRAVSADELDGEWQEHINGAATEELHTRYRLRRAR